MVGLLYGNILTKHYQYARYSIRRQVCTVWDCPRMRRVHTAYGESVDL